MPKKGIPISLIKLLCDFDNFWQVYQIHYCTIYPLPKLAVIGSKHQGRGSRLSFILKAAIYHTIAGENDATL